MEKITLREFEKQWEALFRRDAARVPPEDKTASLLSPDDDDDPFDCSDVAVPPTHELVDKVAEEFVQQWKSLDDRKIAAVEDAGASADGGDDNEGESKEGDRGNPPEQEENESVLPQKKRQKQKAALPIWYERHVRLPEQFDYASKQDNPPPDDGTGDRVVSLENPTCTLSYHTELWKLFREIPSDTQLEEKAVAGCNLPNTRRVIDEIMEARESNANLDAHALARFRMNDRHDLPPFQTNSSSSNSNDYTTPPRIQSFCATLRLEFMRQQLRRSSNPDLGRTVLEFLGTSTLLDVHRALVELTEDDLWEAAQKETNTNSNETTTCNETSGFFFIEGVFYRAGPVDYTVPILQWMQTGNKREQKSRLRTHLGLTECEQLPPVRSMADTRLEDISCRLGMRYVHIIDGDVECAVFATDRRLLPKEATRNLQFPILHDIWSPSYPQPECDACKTQPASIATATTCEQTGGHRLLCEDCCRQLQLPRDQIKRYSEWRGQADFSMGATVDNVF